MLPKETDNDLYGRFDEVVKASVTSPHLPKNAVRFVDMFCGIGGFHRAAVNLGMKCVFACDIDEDARASYKANFGIEPFGDICRLNPSDVPDHDVLFAGFPCQPFSIIGKREGFADARGTLFFELAKIIDAKKPQRFVLENVKQLVGHNHGETLKRIEEILRGMGYSVEHRVFNAINFGLPQKRERVLIMGVLGEVESFPWPEDKIPMRPLSEILEKKPDPKHFVSDRIRKARKADHKAEVSPSIWHENKSGHISSYPYSCALRAGASYNYLLVDGIRRLTSREMYRLQGFPDHHKIVSGDGQARKQAGNAVPVPMVQAVIKGVMSARQRATEVKRKRTAA